MTSSICWDPLDVSWYSSGRPPRAVKKGTSIFLIMRSRFLLMHAAFAFFILITILGYIKTGDPTILIPTVILFLISVIVFIVSLRPILIADQRTRTVSFKDEVILIDDLVGVQLLGQYDPSINYTSEEARQLNEEASDVWYQLNLILKNYDRKNVIAFASHPENLRDITKSIGSFLQIPIYIQNPFPEKMGSLF